VRASPCARRSRLGGSGSADRSVYMSPLGDAHNLIQQAQAYASHLLTSLERVQPGPTLGEALARFPELRTRPDVFQR